MVLAWRASPVGLGAALALGALLVDQLSKWLINNVVMVPPRMIELTPFLNVVLGRNSGVVFGIFADRGDLGRWLLVVAGLAITGILVLWLCRTGRRPIGICLGLVTGGALGNVIDRVRFGAVTDFIDLHAGRWHWPAFNLADVAIVIGLMLLVREETHSARQHIQ